MRPLWPSVTAAPVLPWHDSKNKQGIPATVHVPKSLVFSGFSDILFISFVSNKWGILNNYEFIMNRVYALNRDKLRCRVCGGWLIDCTPYAHRINPNLPLNQVNRVNNLVSLHWRCFNAVNDPNQDISQFDVKAQKKIIGYREKLVPSHTSNK